MRCHDTRLVAWKAVRATIRPLQAMQVLQLPHFICYATGVQRHGGSHSDRHVVRWLGRLKHQCVSAIVRCWVQVGCGGVSAVPPACRTTACHHDGGHLCCLVHLQRLSIAASGPGDASRYAQHLQSVGCYTTARPCHAWRMPNVSALQSRMRHRQLAANCMVSVGSVGTDSHAGLAYVISAFVHTLVGLLQK